MILKPYHSDLLIESRPFFYGTKATIGVVTVNGQFECFSLEDQFRQNGEKVAGETAIGPGLYEITLRKEGGMNDRYSKIPSLIGIHQGMLWLRGVANFEYIYIHVGNHWRDTEGCILLGQTAHPPAQRVLKSWLAYIALYEKCIHYFNGGHRVFFRSYK